MDVGGIRLICAFMVGFALTQAGCSKAKLNVKGQARNLQPKVTQVIPSSGPIGGGTLITILGSGFQAGAVIDFGGSPCINVVYVSESQLQCTTTAHVVGTVSVVITNPNQLLYELGNAYAYFDAIMPVPGFGTLSGGGIVSNASFQVNTSIGEPVKGDLIQSSDMALRPGIQGIFFDQ
jgi:hypothetical protein